MNKTSKIWLIAALSILTGIVLFTVAISALGWDFNKLNNSVYETNTYDLSDKFTDISIDTKTADIVFLPSDSSECRVVCYEQVKMKHSAVVEGNTLSIKVIDTRKWYDYISFTFSSPEITVYLPRGSYDTLKVDTGTGSVDIPDGYNFEEVRFSSGTGNVRCNSSVSGLIHIKTSTGNVNISNISAGELNLSVSTGNVNVKSVACEGNIKAVVSTGKVQMTDITCKNLTSNGNTGKIILENVIASEKFSIKRDTGDVKFIGSDAAEIYVETDTGDITGTLLTEKVFIVQSDVGKIDVPKTITGGRCEISTDTGDIKIKID